jgi:hypothetical protein
MSSLLTQPGRVEEPQVVSEYAAVFNRVAAEGRPIIVCRAGADLAAVVPLEQLQLLQDLLARQEAEDQARQIDWKDLAGRPGPPQAWFDDTDNPCEPETGVPPGPWAESGTGQ